MFVMGLRSDGKPLKQMKSQSSTIVWVMTPGMRGLVCGEIALDRMKLGLYASPSPIQECFHENSDPFPVPDGIAGAAAGRL
jgi:uncharacterized iron-regulated protein